MFSQVNVNISCCEIEIDRDKRENFSCCQHTLAVLGRVTKLAKLLCALS
jgi:hypothetical protein